jgi:hypothetical protein
MLQAVLPPLDNMKRLEDAAVDWMGELAAVRERMNAISVRIGDIQVKQKLAAFAAAAAAATAVGTRDVGSNIGDGGDDVNATAMANVEGVAPDVPTVYQRYCHVYKEGELEELAAMIPEVEVRHITFSRHILSCHAITSHISHDHRQAKRRNSRAAASDSTRSMPKHVTFK